MAVDRCVDNGFLHVDQVRHGDVLRYHGDGLFGWVDVARLEDLARVHASEDGLDPFGCGLLAGDQSLGAEDACRRIDISTDGVDCNDMCGLVIPGTVFLPVGSRYLLPRVVEGDGIREDLHFTSIWRNEARDGTMVLIDLARSGLV